MTEKEAIERIKQTPLMRWAENREGYGESELAEALQMAIHALEEIQKYRAIKKAIVAEEAIKRIDKIEMMYAYPSTEEIVDIIWEIAEKMKGE